MPTGPGSSRTFTVNSWPGATRPETTSKERVNPFTGLDAVAARGAVVGARVSGAAVLGTGVWAAGNGVVAAGTAAAAGKAVAVGTAAAAGKAVVALGTAVAAGKAVAVDKDAAVTERESVGVDRRGGNGACVGPDGIGAATDDVAAICAGGGSGAVGSPPLHAMASANKSDTARPWDNMVPIYNARVTAATGYCTVSVYSPISSS